MSLNARISSLEAKHSDLERAIGDEFQRPIPDNIRITRLKRAKLKLKEQIDRFSPH